MSQKMWGGRFGDGPDDIMEEINASIGFDQRLAHQDVAGSMAHCQMLIDTGILSKEDGRTILDGLNQIEKEISEGTFTFSRALEDIHMNIESRLSDIIGPTGGRLHTARSRNDQVATDFKLYIRDTIDHLHQQIQTLQTILAQTALSHANTLMPGFTHLQIAQPVSYGHHLLAYVEMLNRDKGRLHDARARLNQSPLGAAALAGTSFPIDRHQTAKALGFDKPTDNSIDSVSDRDFVLETLSAGAICMTHLSRLAEEIVVFASSPFGFFILPDAFSTGSSIMPQKRNPDAAELIRAKTGNLIGHLTALLVVMKGLPLAYSKDMQEDKKGTFEALDNLSLCLAAMSGMMQVMEINAEAMASLAQEGFSTATDLADWLVRVGNVPFREAHHITGQIVQLAETKACRLDELPLESMQEVDPRITKDIFDVLSTSNSVASRISYGGTAPENVKAAAQAWLNKLTTA
jgi:argininosuccinate lyase